MRIFSQLLRGRPLKRGFAPLAAIVSFVSAVSCCLPVGTVFAAAGFAGAAAFLSSARPYLMGLSVLLLGVGFWQAYGASNCPVKRNRMAVFLLWTATGLLLLLFLFPQNIAGLLADWFAQAPK